MCLVQVLTGTPVHTELLTRWRSTMHCNTCSLTSGFIDLRTPVAAFCAFLDLRGPKIM